MRERPPGLSIDGTGVEPGERKTVRVPVAGMYTHDDLSMSVHVVSGRRPGPVLFVCAAIHGDELNGVEIIRRVLQHRSLKRIRGTLIAIPVVNVYGLLNRTRYLPDGRDLNRSFPGSAKGSLAGRVANTFVREIVSKCTHGIDLHTGSRHRSNFPQIRANLDDPVAVEMMEAFGVPLAIDARIRDGSLRDYANEAGIPSILYEAGEALRFDEIYIRAGVKGVISVLRRIGMLPRSRSQKPLPQPIISQETTWLRAPESGFLRTFVRLGERVEEGQTIGIVAGPLGMVETPILAPSDGVVIGRTNLPLAHEGDAVLHLARYGRKMGRVEEQVERFHEELQPGEGEGPPESSGEVPIS